MTNVILILIVCSTVITSIVNCAKPAYKSVAWKRTITISTALAFILGIVCAFSVVPMLWLEINAWLTTLVGLALGTWSNIFYDLMELLKSRSDKIKSTLPTKKE